MTKLVRDKSKNYKINKKSYYYNQNNNESLIIITTILNTHLKNQIDDDNTANNKISQLNQIKYMSNEKKFE
jgi:DNA-binding sugar fermentation-stimulating protein